MKQNKKIVSDALCDCIINSISEFNDLSFGDDTWDQFASYFNENYEPDYVGKSLPSKKHLISLIKKNEFIQKNFEEMVENLAAEIIYEFNIAEDYSKNYQLEAAREEREKAERKAKQKKLMESFSPEQISSLRDTFNISI